MNAKVCVATLMGLAALSISVTGQASAESIDIFTLQQEIEKTDDVFVTGFVNIKSSYIPVRLEVYDPNDNLIFIPDVNVNDDGQFRWLFHPPLGKFDTTGTYTIIASHEELSDTATIQFTVIEDTGINNAWLEDIKTKNFDNSERTNTFSGDIVQDNTIANAENLPQGGNSENDQKTSTEQIVKSENTSNQTNVPSAESPVIITAVALVIAGIVSGIVIWMRATYQKQAIERQVKY